jgi:gluconolactonase
VPPVGGPVQLLVDDFDQPNGLCFSPDESLLYINDTPRAHIRVFDVRADGTLTSGRVFFEGIGRGVIEEGVTDGMKCDERGVVYVTGPKGVWVISATGELLRVIEVPENVGNLAWGDDDRKTLYLASSSSVYRLRTEVAGSIPRFMR